MEHYEFDKIDAIIEIDVAVAERAGCVFYQTLSNAVLRSHPVPPEALLAVSSAKETISWACKVRRAELASAATTAGGNSKQDGEATLMPRPNHPGPEHLREPNIEDFPTPHAVPGDPKRLKCASCGYINMVGNYHCILCHIMTPHDHLTQLKVKEVLGKVTKEADDKYQLKMGGQL